VFSALRHVISLCFGSAADSKSVRYLQKVQREYGARFKGDACLICMRTAVSARLQRSFQIPVANKKIATRELIIPSAHANNGSQLVKMRA
jgi:hypothetical protein